MLHEYMRENFETTHPGGSQTSGAGAMEPKTMTKKKPETIQISLVLPKSEHLRLQKLAAAEHRPFVNYVRHVLRTRTEAAA